MPNLEQLRPFSAISHLGDAQLERLAKVLETRSLAADDSLISRGDSSDQIYFLERGELRVKRTTSYGDFDIATVGAGEIVGELGFIDRRERPNDVAATEGSDLLVLERTAVTQLVEDDPTFDLALHWAFWKALSEKLRSYNRLLSAFFTPGEGGDVLDDRAAYERKSSGSPGMDLAAKRGVFEEQALSTMEINFLASLSSEERFEPGQKIFYEGETGDRMYVVVEGEVMISTVVAGAGEEALSFLGRGEFFGEMALIDHRPRSADACAHPSSGAVVLAIPREVVEGILDIEKVASLRLLKLLCRLIAKRLRAIDEKLAGWFVLSGGELSSNPG